MPYGIRHKGNKHIVYNKETGDVKGSHDSMSSAERQINLLRGIEHGWQPTGKKARSKML